MRHHWKAYENPRIMVKTVWKSDEYWLKPLTLTDVARDLVAIDLRLNIRNGCDDFQHAEYFTCDLLIPQPIFTVFTVILKIS